MIINDDYAVLCARFTFVPGIIVNPVYRSARTVLKDWRAESGLGSVSCAQLGGFRSIDKHTRGCVYVHQPYVGQITVAREGVRGQILIYNLRHYYYLLPLATYLELSASARVETQGAQTDPRDMKAMVVSPVGGRVPPSRGVLHSSLGINGTRRDLEAEEVAAYLTKLRSLVPDMPRKRKLSKLEVIQRVIEYICDLQTTLEETNVHHESSVTKTTTRQPLQPLLNATTAAPTTTTASTTTTMTGLVAER